VATVIPSQRSFTFQDHVLAFDEFGEGDRPLVLVPGLLLPRRMHHPLAERLAGRGNRVLCLDPLGSGASDRPPDPWRYTMSAFGDQVVALLDHLEIDEAVVGGTSLGANVSLEAAVRAPDRVRGLVLEMPVLESATLACLATFTPLMASLRYAAPGWRLLGAAARRVPRGPTALGDTLLDWVSQDPVISSVFLQGLAFGRIAPPREDRMAIAAPALVLAHTFDPIHALTDAAAAAGELPNAELVRARTFFEMRFSTQRLGETIADFIDDCWAGRRGGAAPVDLAETG
jgi:pimeloyl-ACP methyl ester carboxylesterase